MSRRPLNPWPVAGIVLMALIVFSGGWILLDGFLKPYLVQPGSGAVFQEVSQAAAMEQPVIYLGPERCGECHRSILSEWLHSPHRTVVCENCHDPGRSHVEEVVPMTVNASSSLCLTCHKEPGSRPCAFAQADADGHGGGLSCLECHSPMHPDVEEAPQMIHTTYQGADCLICHASQAFQPAPTDHEQRSAMSCRHCHDGPGELQ